MLNYDVAVIGAGLLGCFTARNLKRYNLSVALIEKRGDVCLGISKANTAVVYAGYDNRPGSLKAELCVRGNRNFERLCRDLDVAFKRTGSLMLSYGAQGDVSLEKKLRHGRENGVEGLEILTLSEARRIEGELGEGITSALYAPSTGTVNPWELCIAAYENAVSNGADIYFNTEVISCSDGIVRTSGEDFKVKAVVDCSGPDAGRIAGSKYYSVIDAADYVVMDRASSHKPSCILFEQSEEKCRGITVVPTVEGSVLIGPSHREFCGESFCRSDEIDKIVETAAKVIPKFNGEMIRTFAGQRPNICSDDGEDIHDFMIDDRGDIISLVGIKTPGLTCADELGRYVAEKCADRLHAEPNGDFDGTRKGAVRLRNLPEEQRNLLIESNPDFGEIVCVCEQISKAEILEAIKRGARTPEGVKHRCGAMMGRCQGSRCYQKILAIMEENNVRL